MRLTSIDPTPFHSLRYWTSGPGKKPRLRELPFVHAKAEGLPDGVRSIVLVSDLQGREYLSRSLKGTERLLGEAVADELSLLMSLEEIPEINAILVCGDLYDYPDCRKPGGTGPVESVFWSLAEVASEVFGVLGNHDTLDVETPLPSCVTILDGDVVGANFGLRIGGVSGIIGDPKRHNRRGDEAFIKIMEQCTRKRPDILMLHQGPEDKDRRQLGDPAITLSLETGFSGFTLFGHSHWPAFPLVKLGDGQGLNVDARLVVVAPEMP
ncbi:hypothetical protein DYI41_16585 [Marinobacter salarius]|uniref:metallophosphoesterase family protein n=1 Tax=Marinobacter salarius TaxID=1420917 RepID=UPI001BCFCD92|nr:metallophosphoesterase [Marinobacter salarius]MBS8232549.1 hypothetical protein [Marinobacter salarius]